MIKKNSKVFKTVAMTTFILTAVCVHANASVSRVNSSKDMTNGSFCSSIVTEQKASVQAVPVSSNVGFDFRIVIGGCPGEHPRDSKCPEPMGGGPDKRRAEHEPPRYRRAPPPPPVPHGYRGYNRCPPPPPPPPPQPRRR